MSETSSNLSQWVGVLWSVMVGAVGAIGGLITLAWRLDSRVRRLEHMKLDDLHSRVQKLEVMDIGAVARSELEGERHHILYPMLQTRVFAPIDKIEDELKIQGQNIAVLLERDRTSVAFERMAEQIGKSVAAAVIEGLKAQRREP